MPLIKFGQWMPDIGSLVNPGVARALNVVPAPDGFSPARAHAPSSSAVSERPLGALAAISKALAVFQYCGGPTKLFMNVGGAWQDRSRTVGGAYAATSVGFWDFVQWGSQIIATDGFDVPQIANLGSGNFDDLDMGLWPFKAKFVTVIRNHVVMAHLDDLTDPEGDSQRPSRVKWSGFNNETAWVPDAATLSDYEDLKQQKIVRIFGGEYGVVFQPAAIWKMTYIGAPAAFQFDEVVSDIGLIGSGAACQVGDTIFFWSQKGFFALTAGSKLTPIGANKIDAFATQDLDKNYTYRISAASDPRSHQIHFLYPGAGNTGGEPNRRLVYDTATGGWSLILENLSLIWSSAGVSVDLDSPEVLPGDPLDLDAPDPVSFDDPRWVSDAYSLAAFNPTFQNGFFDGAVLTAEIETPEYAFNPNGRASLQGFRPLVESGTITAQVGTRDSLGSDVQWGPTLTTSRDLKIYTRSNARYHRMRFQLAGEWDHAMGFETEDRDVRMGEGRG